MSVARMHADEVDTDADLVRRLLAAQFPHWAELPIERVASSGTDHAIYRLGDALAARLPRRPGAKYQVHKEHRWLPALAAQLPLAVPVTLAKGEPGLGYPFHWSVCRWLEGENATLDRLADPCAAATALAGFIAALQRIDASDGPAPGPHNVFRGVRLAARDSYTRAAIEKLRDLLDAAAVSAAWDAALQAPRWDRPPVWIHGDLTASNLLAVSGRLAGVIDFGCLGVGDPACDLLVAWSLFTGDARRAFRAALGVDDAAWARGRGWALSTALIAIPYYRNTNPAIVARGMHEIAAVLADREP